MAGGMAFGSTFGVMLEPVIGWRGVFLAVSACGFLTLILLRPYLALLGERSATKTLTLDAVMTGYRQLLSVPRAQRTYFYVFMNAAFHSGVFTWLGLYFSRRYGLGEIGIGIALLGYGVPGFVLGPFIGRVADRWGRRWLVPAGLGLAALSALLLTPAWPLAVAVVAVTFLSLGYDMTQPPLAGIVTTLDPPRAGQAMGLNVFALFIGFGLGSLLFGSALQLGFTKALLIFAGAQAVAWLAAVALFRSERS
jgi:predicted MFS family arabinose efflux permease